MCAPLMCDNAPKEIQFFVVPNCFFVVLKCCVFVALNILEICSVDVTSAFNTLSRVCKTKVLSLYARGKNSFEYSESKSETESSTCQTQFALHECASS